jgi:hypothetical protein
MFFSMTKYLHSADIWSVASMMIELIRGRNLYAKITIDLWLRTKLASLTRSYGTSD